ncbi:hypothetical protein TL16_g10344 [Triparma laevis f. inornata]|uniref:Uncharacterized protein n=1 Tax=Triparma laevis f. inornata TaxID=1714386 RepID=A0A9W7B7S7_9STRA|nr:hypothetical protein TL16_g10344 [Triparma laevis f. inornata]
MSTLPPPPPPTIDPETGLQTEYSYILTLTSLPLTLLAAAISHWGVDILIIDSNKNYGGVNFTGLAHDIETHIVPGEVPGTRRITRRPRELPKVGDEIDTAYGNGIWKKNNYRHCYIQLPYGVLHPSPSLTTDYTRLTIPFLTLPLIFSNPSISSIIPTLLSSSVSEYIRFKSLQKTSLIKNGIKQILPSSRSDIFNDTSLTLLEKNKILKVLRLAHTQNLVSDELDKESSTTNSRALRAPQGATVGGEDVNGDSDFGEWLKVKVGSSKKTLIHPGLTLSLSPIKTVTGLKTISNHIKSLDLHSESPYISPIYGMGELCQGFARKASVMGAVFILECEVEKGEGGVKLSSERIGWKDIFVKSDNIIQQSLIKEGRKLNKVWGFVKGETSFSLDVNESYIVVRGGESMKFTNCEGVYYCLVYSPTMSSKELDEILEEEGEVIMKGECTEWEYANNFEEMEVGGGGFEKDFEAARWIYESLREKDERLGEWFGVRRRKGRKGRRRRGWRGGEDEDEEDEEARALRDAMKALEGENEEDEREDEDEDEDEDEEAKALRLAMRALEVDGDLDL